MWVYSIYKCKALCASSYFSNQVFGNSPSRASLITYQADVYLYPMMSVAGILCQLVIPLSFSVRAVNILHCAGVCM